MQHKCKRWSHIKLRAKLICSKKLILQINSKECEWLKKREKKLLSSKKKNEILIQFLFENFN